MRSIRRLALALGAALAFTLAGCGDKPAPSSAPSNANKQPFCAYRVDSNHPAKGCQPNPTLHDAVGLDSPLPAVPYSPQPVGGYFENPAPGDDGTTDCPPGGGPVYVGSNDPNGFDGDGDGWGCE
jgi:hypothetical protein